MTPASLLALARQLGALAHATRVHDINNRAVLRVLEGVVAALRTLAQETGQVRLEFDGDTFVVDGTLVRLRRDVRAQLQLLVTPLRERGAGGFTVGVDVAERHLIALFRALQAVVPGARLDEIQARIDGLDGVGLSLLPPRVAVTGLVGGGGQSVRTTLSEALRAYLRALVTVQQALEAGTLAAVPPPVYRALQTLTELAEEDPRIQLGLAAIRSDTDYALRHPVNSAILAIALGRRMGLDRRALMDVATAALVVAALPPDPSGQDRLAAAAQLVTRPEISSGRVRRILVMLESGLRPDRSGTPVLPLAGPLHLYSRMVALVTAFDERTTSLGTRPAELPDEALASLAADPRFDAELVRLMAAMLGRWPLGSGVLLDSGEIGIVFHTPADPNQADRPVVRLVRDAAGRAIEPPPLLDLGAPGEVRRAVRGVDISVFGVDAQRALYG